MIATFTDLLLRIVLAIGLSKVCGYIGLWFSWLLGWILGTSLSLYFFYNGAGKNAEGGNI